MADVPTKEAVERGVNWLMELGNREDRILAQRLLPHTPNVTLQHVYARLLKDLQAERERLEAENAALAAGQCIVPGGLVGDEGGTPVCTVVRERDELRETDPAIHKAWAGALDILGPFAPEHGEDLPRVAEVVIQRLGAAQLMRDRLAAELKGLESVARWLAATLQFAEAAYRKNCVSEGEPSSVLDELQAALNDSCCRALLKEQG